MHKHRASPGENEENRRNEGWGKPERGGEINPSKEEKEGGTNREDGGGGGCPPAEGRRRESMEKGAMS